MKLLALAIHLFVANGAATAGAGDHGTADTVASLATIEQHEALGLLANLASSGRKLDPLEAMGSAVTQGCAEFADEVDGGDKSQTFAGCRAQLEDFTEQFVVIVAELETFLREHAGQNKVQTYWMRAGVAPDDLQFCAQAVKTLMQQGRPFRAPPIHHEPTARAYGDCYTVVWSEQARLLSHALAQG